MVPLLNVPVAATVPSPPCQSITVLLALDEMVSVRFTLGTVWFWVLAGKQKFLQGKVLEMEKIGRGGQ